MATKAQVLTCPFCGDVPTMERWHGGGPQKRMIHCEGVYCEVTPSVTGETAREAADRWNTRKNTGAADYHTIEDRKKRAA